MTSWAEGIPFAGAEPAVERGRHAVHYAAVYPERSSRVRTLFRLALAIPAYIATALFISIAQILASVAWLIIVFSGQYDQTLWRFSVGCLRRMAVLSCYLSLLRDEYPPFGEGRYPLGFEIDYARRRSRLSAFFRMLLVIPQLVVLYFLSLPWMAAVAIAWFAILVTGRYPRGLWLLVEGFNRWNIRVQAYALLLTDEFPPYSLDLDDSATPPEDTAVVPALEFVASTLGFAPAPSELRPTVPEYGAPAADISSPATGFAAPSLWMRPAAPDAVPGEAENPASFAPPPPAAGDAHSPGFFAFPPRPAAAEVGEPERPDEPS